MFNINNTVGFSHCPSLGQIPCEAIEGKQVDHKLLISSGGASKALALLPPRPADGAPEGGGELPAILLRIVLHKEKQGV